jgi:DNA-directed RNA polymerase specialized sigma24 family protein
MPEPDDIKLLKEYAGGDESAFTALFERHVHLVYSAALRQSRNPSHAEEITQAVSILLVRKAKLLSPKTVWSGWLYQAARLTTASLIKREIRRQRREQEVYMQAGSSDCLINLARARMATLRLPVRQLKKTPKPNRRGPDPIVDGLGERRNQIYV